MEDYSRLDNYKLIDMIDGLELDSVISRFYPLIENKEKLLSLFKKNNMIYKNDVNLEMLSSDFSQTTLNLLFLYLHLYDYKKRSIREFEENDQMLLSSLSYKSTYDILSDEREDISELVRIKQLANLMRLPGVKYIRANLYYLTGFKDFRSFFKYNPQTIQEIISDYIIKNNRNEHVPLLKEIKTHVAVARMIEGIK